MRKTITAAILVLPLLLGGGCNGIKGILNGEKLKLWDDEDPAPATLPKPKPAAGTPAVVAPLPGDEKKKAAAACKPTAHGEAPLDHPELVAIAQEVKTLEDAQISRKELRAKIIEFASKELELDRDDLRKYTEGLLARSKKAPAPSTPPAPQKPQPPAETPTPEVPAKAATTASALDETAPAAPYALHPSLVAFVAYQHAVAYARDKSGLTLKPTELKTFCDQLLAYGEPEVALIAFTQLYELAMDPAVLDLGSRPAAAERVSKVLHQPNGVPLALGYVETYRLLTGEYKFEVKEAISQANAAICFDMQAKE